MRWLLDGTKIDRPSKRSVSFEILYGIALQQLPEAVPALPARLVPSQIVLMSGCFGKCFAKLGWIAVHRAKRQRLARLSLESVQVSVLVVTDTMQNEIAPPACR